VHAKLSAFDRRTLLNLRRATGLLILCFRLLLLLQISAFRRSFFASPQQVVHASASHQASALRGKIQSLPAPRCAPETYGTNLCHDALQLFYTPAEASMFDDRSAHTARTLRKRCKTADSNSVNSSHGESPFLLPVQRIVGSVQVQDDFLRRFLVGSRKTCTSKRSRLRDPARSFLCALSDCGRARQFQSNSEYFSPPKFLDWDPTSPPAPPAVDRSATLVIVQISYPRARP